MKARVTPFVMLLFLFAQAYPAMAAWGSFVSLGTNPVNSDPSCAPFTSGAAVCAARSFTNSMLVDHFSGTTWSGWENLPGVITSAPSCASDGSGQVICAARAPSGGMVYSVFNGSAWRAEVTVKGTLASGPSCATLGGGRILCAARSSTGGLTSSVFSGTSWSAFDNQAATTTSAPGCGSDDGERVICMMQDTSSNEIANRYDGTKWDGFINTGGRGTGDPTCTNFGVAGEAVCFGRGTDSALWGNRFAGGSWATSSWTGWGTLGGLVGAKATCANLAANEVVCGVFGVADSALWVNEYNGTTWLGFGRLGRTSVGNPSCTTLAHIIRELEEI